MKILVGVLLALYLICLCAGQQPIRKFQAAFTASETYLDSNNVTQSRNFTGVLSYEDTYNINNPVAGTFQAIRYDIYLGTTLLDNTTLTELSIYQDQFLKYTICRGSCAWQDIFAEEPLPKLWAAASDSSSGTEVLTVSGAPVTATIYTFNQLNVVNRLYTGFTKIWIHPTTGFVLKAEINYSNGVKRTLLLGNHATNFDSAVIFAIPDFCPFIEPGCLRLDIVFVLDLSGSVTTAGVTDAFNFLRDVSIPLYIDPKYIGVGLTTFSFCYSAAIRLNMIYNKTQWQSSVATIRTQVTSNGYTCIVGGMQRAMWVLAPVNGSRQATPDALVVVTDGNANRPCSPITVFQNPNENCQVKTNGSSTCCPLCIGYSGCDDSPCCRSQADFIMLIFHSVYTNVLVPALRIYAIGVGPSITPASLNLIVNDVAATSVAKTNVFRVGSYSQLNTIINSLVAAILCNNPGSEVCPNDCRPGGFCCAGGCLCSTDCTTRSTDCQTGFCRVNSQGAACVLGNPDDSLCNSLAFDKQCKNWFCQANVGCNFVINDNLFCTDSNPCTDDVCVNGVCSVNKNNVTQCSDSNECTINDRCLPDGSCAGTANDFNTTCEDGNLCTNNSCSGDRCVVSSNKICTDDNLADCVVPKCDAATGICTATPVKPGFQCRPPPPGDNCTVYICENFNPDDFVECVNSGREVAECSGGECVEKRRDIDECKGSSDNIGPIIGGVIAGVAFLAIVAILIAVFLLILLRNKIPAVLGGINPFASGTNVVTPGTYVEPNTSGASGIFESPS